MRPIIRKGGWSFYVCGIELCKFTSTGYGIDVIFISCKMDLSKENIIEEQEIKYEQSITCWEWI
ncbi:MAG: hypothetical protein IJO60_05260 [Agathobacter sp.]|nr:hypothetical protein [Agathobacter sp.]